MGTKVIALDAGHGLKTPGKRTPDGIHEWELNDKVRDKVVEFLKDYDVSFIFTDNNEGNTDESLASRLKKYLDAKVDVFVSIHHNAFTSTWNSATGVEVWVDLNNTAEDMKLAEAIYKNLPKYTGLKGRGIKKENWWVINQNKIPAVLVEGGFMDSKNDYKVITSEKGQEAYARAVAEGLIEYLKLTKKKITSENTTAKKEESKKTEKIDVKYQVYSNGKWLEDIVNFNNKNSNGYAGIFGKAISGFRGNTVGKESDVGNLIYKVHTKNGNWLGEIKDREKDKSGDDFAGILGKEIDAIMIKSTKGKATYRVHIKNGKWLPWVTGYSAKDDNNGYAGILGKEIDAIQVEIV